MLVECYRCQDFDLARSRFQPFASAKPYAFVPRVQRGARGPAKLQDCFWR